MIRGERDTALACQCLLGIEGRFMLVRFTVENCLSFRDRVEFSMVASAKVRRHPEHVIRPEDSDGPSVLKLGIIYGANASGKSNPVKAINWALRQIRNPARPGERIDHKPFKLDPKCRRKPGRFEFEIKTSERLYLHPEILHSYVANFLKYSAGRRSQLIVTTHDTTLFNQPFLRRDEVWLVEKGRDQSSRLVSLEEFKDVDQIEDLQRGYIQGRFGGVPIIRDFSWLGSDDGKGA